MSNPDNTVRDFSTISPSAVALMYLKAMTDIPYAREAAVAMLGDKPFEPHYTNNDITFWARMVHFERRYWSIDHLLEGLDINNILEISSGFSLRGMAAVKQPGVRYIDTDLPNIIDTKRQLIKAIEPGALNEDSPLQILPLNALNEAEFMERVNRFPQGEVAIINEGLMMYLGQEEKDQLCKVIHHVLQQRGGYWITADIYVKNNEESKITRDDELAKFFKQHNIDDNKFDNFEAAEAFFNRNGFVVEKEATVDRTKLSSLPYLLKFLSPQQLKQLSKASKIQATWRLKAI